MIIRNHIPFRSNIRCWRKIYLVMIKRRLRRTVKDVGAENNLLNDLGFNLCVAPWSLVMRLVAYFGVVEVIEIGVLSSQVEESERIRCD